MNRPIDLASTIHGWGVDLDPARRPAYPKEKTPEGGTGAHWKEPEQQQSDVKVFKSTERPRVTPVFGTSRPPRGLSGVLRKWAYTYSESRLQHWFILMAADRVDVVEGLLEDLRHGRIPNIPAEMGIKSEIRHNPTRLARNVALGLGAIALAGFGLGSVAARR